MHIVPSSTTSKAAYRAFCNIEEELPIFFQDWYMNACAIDGSWEVILVYHDQQIIAVYTYFIKSKWNFKYITMPLFQKWMGLYINSNFRTYKWEKRILQAVVQHLPQLDRFEQNLFPDIQNWSPFYWQSYQQTTYYTYQIDLLQSIEQIKSNIQGNVRRNIQQADALFHLKEELMPKTFYEINEMSFHRKDEQIPYQLSTFLQHHRMLQQHQSGKILAAQNKEGTICAVCYLIWDKQSCYYHLAGDVPFYRKQAVGIWLIWQAICYAKEKLQRSVFDFEGSMLPGVAQVRQRFGAKPLPYHFISKSSNHILRVVTSLRSIFHQ